MQDALSRIISSMILNITQVKNLPADQYDLDALSKSTQDGLNILSSTWPNLTDIEKQEIKSIISSLEVTYNSSKFDKNRDTILKHK